MNDPVDRYGLTETQLEVVGLIERRFSRAAIAAYLGVSLQTARDIVGGLCDHYGCPAHELPVRVREGITASPAEISTAGGNGWVKLSCGCHAEWDGECWKVAAMSFLCGHHQGDEVTPHEESKRNG